MIKFLCFLLALPPLVFNANAGEEGFSIGIKSEEISGKSRYFTFRSITDKDFSAVSNLISQCGVQEELPVSPRRWTTTLIKRQQEERNPYSALVVEEANDSTTVAAVLGLGRMDVFRELNHDIIDMYIELGIIKYTDNDHIAYVGKQGLGTLCPIIPLPLEEEKIKDILRIGVKTFRFLKESGTVLPVEETEPAYVIGLFHPDDPLLSHLEAVGFTIVKKDGFRVYCNGASRDMAYLKL